ncbi:hypothetical protein HOY33_11445 [Brenneria sp. hezel4-2-4]|nr:hypothetical protein [Brenneria sp. hezel4-2-4]
MTQIYIQALDAGRVVNHSDVFSRPWPKEEWLVATALDVHPAEIWPSRYFDDSGILLDRKARREKGLRQGK